MGTELLIEERQCKIVSKLLGLPLDTWYKTEETTSTEYTYSVVKISDKEDYCPNEKRGLLFGVNPRMTGSDSYEEEVLEFYSDKKNDPHLRHRQAYKDALEPTRSHALVDMLGISNNVIEKLITVDLFAERTHTADELKERIHNQEDVEKIIGAENKKNLFKQIDSNPDIIIIAWGNVADILVKVPDYCKELYIHLEKQLGKIWWYGANSNGQPRHIVYRKKDSIRKMNKEELKAVLLV